MTCYSPLQVLQGLRKKVNGKKEIYFNPLKAPPMVEPLQLPCGKCVGCRIEYSRQWAVRCYHEASLHQDNCFLTLTFNDENLPPNGALDKRVFQLFIKRMRKFFNCKFLYYHCGEYGEQFLRPHYHACIFGLDFPDRELFSITGAGQRLYTSKILDSLWSVDGKQLGFASIGEVTFESAAYVARYVMKKALVDYEGRLLRVCPESGEIMELPAEYTTMSLKPAIGLNWFRRFKDDLYPSDECVVKGVPTRPPRYYDSQYEHIYPSDMEAIKVARKERALLHADNCTPERLAVREEVVRSRIVRLIRPLEV